MAATTTTKVLSVFRRGSCNSPFSASRILFTGKNLQIFSLALTVFTIVSDVIVFEVFRVAILEVAGSPNWCVFVGLTVPGLLTEMILLYTIPMNANGYVPNLIKILDTTVSGVTCCLSSPPLAVVYPLHATDASLRYRDGLPVFSVPLPSRQETCEFVLKPISHTVGDFFKFMKEEDHGIDNISIYTKEGIKVAKSTTIDNLLKNEFWLIVNNREYHVTPPEPILPPSRKYYEGQSPDDDFRIDHEDLDKLSDVKMLVSQLYSALNIEQYQLERESQLLQRLEDLKVQLEPLEKVKRDLEQRANRRTNILSWLGLGMMGLQFGILARLTWWEYSWDIMEPVTYFVTYGTTMAMYAYFVVTKQEYNFLEVKDRQYLLSFYKNAQKRRLDVRKYNNLRDAISQVEYDLLRLRDPLQLQLPIGHIQKQKS